MNTRILTLAFVVLVSASVDAGRTRKCRPTNKCRTQSSCSSSCANGPTTTLWKGKDGEIREVITHWAALHRSVEADQLEVDLVGVRSELEASQGELVALREKAAVEKASFEQQIAKLKNQLGKQRKLAASEKQRAEKAEAAHSKSAAEVVSLRDAGKKTQTVLTKVQNDLQQTVADRDKLTAANAQLQKGMAEITAAKTKADSVVQAAHAEIKKMKQEALETKKAAVVKEDAEQEKDPPEDVDAATEEEPADEEKPEASDN
jgi:chromosome segregation ATPase